MEQLIKSTRDEMRRALTGTSRKIINEMADKLACAGFPEGKKIGYAGPTESKVSYPQMWVEYDRETDEYKMRFNLCEKPETLYVSDLLNPRFLEGVKDSANKAYNAWSERHEAEEWVNDGKPCRFRYGWGWKGAGARKITNEEAKKLLPKHSFGKGFWTLDWETFDGEKALVFGELSESDMY